MNKRKQPQSQNLNLSDYLGQYDAVTLHAIVNSFESSPAWDIFRAYLKLRQREFEIASLDMVAKGQTHPSAHASGYAQGVGDVADAMIQEFKNLVSGVSPVVETPRPEESNL